MTHLPPIASAPARLPPVPPERGRGALSASPFGRMRRPMKITIDETQRGLLVRDGKVVEWLEPGRHIRWAWTSDLRVAVIDLDQPVYTYRPEVARVAPESAWREQVVSADEIALVAVDGLAKVVLRPGRYMLWQERAEVTAEVYSVSELIPGIPEADWRWVPSDLAEIVTVTPYERVLVYEDGRLSQVLEAGRYLLSKLNRSLVRVRVDLREREKTIVGQEVMTADKVSLRLTVILKHQIVDAVRSVEQVESVGDALYSETQMAARRMVAGMTLDRLLEDRRSVADGMTAEVAARAETWGVRVVAVDVKDVVLPGEMKVLLNRVIEAEKQAAAQVILRREETAAVRSQANTAKMLEANPTLMRLKELEALKEIAGSISDLTVVAGADKLIEQIVGNKVY